MSSNFKDLTVSEMDDVIKLFSELIKFENSIKKNVF